MKQLLNFCNPYAWLVRLALALGFLLCIGSSFFMFANKDIAPDWDLVGVIYFLLGGVDGTPPDWFSSDVFDYFANEHRPFLPMIIWGFDFEYFDSYGLLPQILMQLFAIITAVLATGWSRLPSHPSSMPALAIAIGAFALMLSPMHYENLVWPMQIPLYTSVLFSVLALSLAVSIPRRSWRQQVTQALACSFLAVCATFSFGYGLIVWPVLLIHGLLSRWPWRGYLIIIVSGAVTVAIYYAQFTMPQHLRDPTEFILDPIALTNYASLLLAGPMVGTGIGVTLGHVVGYMMLAVFAYASFRVYVQRHVIDDQQLRSLLICFYCVGVAMLTALGRVTANIGLDSRYMVIPALFILAMPGLFQFRSPIQTMGKQLGMVSFLFGILVLSAASFLNDDQLRIRQFMIRDGAIAAAFDTKPLHRGLFPVQDIINHHVWPYFVEHHGHVPPLNIFSWLGKAFPPSTLIDHSTASEPQCMGHVDGFANREGDTEFHIPRGWARLGPKGEREARWVIVTNSSDVVVGLATMGVVRPDVEKILNASWLDKLLSATNRAGFEGLVRSQPGEGLNFFAYKDGEVCQFARNVLDLPHQDFPLVPGWPDYKAFTLIKRGNVLHAEASDLQKRIGPKGKPVLLAHADTRIVILFPEGSQTLSVGYGILDEAWQGAKENSSKADGVEFRVLAIFPDGREEVLFAQWLDPHANPSDRGEKKREIDLTGMNPQDIALETLKGPKDDPSWDWSYWSEFKVEFKQQ